MRDPESPRAPAWIWLVVGLGGIGFVAMLLVGNNCGWPLASQVGDAFGIVAGVASVGALVGALLSVHYQRHELALQREEMGLQRQEMEESRGELAKQAKSLGDAAAAQTRLVEAEQRLVEAQHEAVKIHDRLVKAQLTQARSTLQAALLEHLVSDKRDLSEVSEHAREIKKALVVVEMELGFPEIYELVEQLRREAAARKAAKASGDGPQDGSGS